MKTVLTYFSCVLVYLSLSAQTKPNFVVILADDLGWMDINSNAEYLTGTKPNEQFYETPHISALAEEGVSFSRCYSGPLCTPSRATIVTGRNGAMFGFNNARGMRSVQKKGKGTFFLENKKPLPGYLPHDSEPPTRSSDPIFAGTSCYALPNGGEDDLGTKVYALPEMFPDYHCGFLGKWHLGGTDEKGHRPQDFGFDAISYEDEGFSAYKKGIRKKWHHPGPAPVEDYLTDDLTALAVDWLEQHQNETPEKPFLLYFCHFAVHDPIDARPQDVAYFEKKKTLGWNGQTNPTYAGMVRALDDSVGTIQATLKRLNIDKNTVIIFTSDNGGIGRKKGKTYTSNLPLRGQKAQTYEGGIRVPFIVSSPAFSKNDFWIDTPISLEDIAPTLAAFAKQEVAPEMKQQWTGRSLLPLLVGQEPEPRSIFVHEARFRIDSLSEEEARIMPNTVIIEGNYKLIGFHDGVMRLYDLEADVGEQNDLSAQMPERVSEMKKRLMEWRIANVPARYDSSVNEDYTGEQSGAELFVR